MKALQALINDDFPLSPDCWVDSKKYYDAFLRAEEYLNTLSKDIKENNPDRRLHELTSHFYRSEAMPETLFRKRDDASDILCEIWLSRVREIADWYVAANTAPPCEGLKSSDLVNISRRFANVNTLTDLGPFLAQRGIILVIEPSIPGMKTDGAIFRLYGSQIVIGMSLRYSRLDYFWFTLMHELAHVVLHLDRLSTPILDDLDEERPDISELQADRMAGDSLIPKNEWRSCPARYSLSDEDVLRFAEKIGVSPQTVAGRIRKEMGRFDLFSEIINKYNTREIFGVNSK